MELLYRRFKSFTYQILVKQKSDINLKCFWCSRRFCCFFHFPSPPPPLPFNFLVLSIWKLVRFLQEGGPNFSFARYRELRDFFNGNLYFSQRYWYALTGLEKCFWRENFSQFCICTSNSREEVENGRGDKKELKKGIAFPFAVTALRVRKCFLA